jgi:hypothetical protein
MRADRESMVKGENLLRQAPKKTPRERKFESEQPSTASE